MSTYLEFFTGKFNIENRLSFPVHVEIFATQSNYQFFIF